MDAYQDASPGPARTALLLDLAGRWRGHFVGPEWCVEAAWAPASVPHAGQVYVCWGLLYARIEAHPLLPDDLLERVVVHELAELELYEVGRELEALTAELDDTDRRLRALEAHRAARHRVIERKVARLLPGPRAVPVWTGAGFAPAGGALVPP